MSMMTLQRKKHKQLRRNNLIQNFIITLLQINGENPETSFTLGIAKSASVYIEMCYLSLSAAGFFSWSSPTAGTAW